MMDYSNNDSQYIEEAKDLVINSIGEAVNLYGISRNVGGLYGIMVSEGSMTLDRMWQQLQMNKPSMDTGVEKLQEYNTIKQQFTHGSRRQHFIARKDFFTFSHSFSTEKQEREIDANMEAIEDIKSIIHPLLERNNIDEEVKKQAINVKAQLDHSKIYYEQPAQLSEALESGETFNCLPTPNEQHHHNQ